MQTLNEAQRQAVTQGNGAALVLAGAGSGKTRVIVERLSWLVDEKGVDPRQLLALTFTNRAAAEMKSRTASRLGTDKFGAWVGTFHSFGLYVLRRDMDKLNRSKNFSIIDDSDQLSLMKRLIQGLGLGAAVVTPRKALSWISRLKQEGGEPDLTQAPEDPEEESCRSLWTSYHAALARASAVDFDDLLVLTAKLLDENEEVRLKYGHRFRFVHIDEYQDTNRAQYRIALRLSEVHGNLFVVGDEDQAIYSWRGADIRNILDFAQDFPTAKVFRLEENYRSTAPILTVANAVVANNTNRLGKTLFTRREGGQPVRYYTARHAEEEAAYVVDEAAKSEHKCAVLYRTNGQSRLFEEALRRRGLGYVVVGGIQFYGRKEVKDLLAYMRLLANPSDDVALRRILNVPARGLGTTTVQRIEEQASARKTPLMEVLRETDQDHSYSGRVRAAIDAFVRMLDELRMQSLTAPVGELAARVLEATGYRDYVEQSDEKDFRTRLEIVDEFVSACVEYDEREGQGLQAFLQDLALLSDIDTLEAEPPRVTLLTCHSAKGLEFDEVFLVGLEEGLLPHAIALTEDDNVEEERRLCYVAMTRARKRLTLTSAEKRVLYGEPRECRPSRFIDEIPEKAMLRLSYMSGAQPMARPERTPVSGPAGHITTGTRVRHALFGKGVVQYTKGNGEKLRAYIRFDTGGAREIMVSKAPLEILKGGPR